MNRQNDPIDRALQSLGNEKWPGEGHNPELETKLMQEFDKQSKGFSIRRHPLIAACLGVLLLGSLGFAAADLIGSWFMTVEVNGEVVAEQVIIPDENGEAEFDLPPLELEDGETAVATITMEGEAAADDGQMRNIQVTLDGSGGHVVVEKGELTEDED